MRLKIKTPHTQVAITIDDVPVEELVDAIRQVDPSKPVAAIESGFPPKPVAMTGGRLSELGIRSGDVIKVSYHQAPAQPHVQLANKNYAILRNIPDDNSCMFHAVLAALDSPSSVAELRQVVASTIRARPDQYPEVVLGRSPDAYCKWITTKDAWGGAIELGILAEWLGYEINCVDVESASVIGFGEGLSSDYILLMYSGVHYDVVVDINGKGLWSGREPKEAAVALARLLQSKDYATNTTTFRVRCLQCYEILVGESGAQRHAEATGHVSFGEVKKK
ncbi:ubiquitin thioesterase Otu1p [Diutina catenulata]